MRRHVLLVARRTGGVSAALWLLVVPPAARASGFLLHDQSASALAQGGAVIAEPAEPAAVWFNPAALGFSSGAGLAASGAIVLPRVTFSGGGTETESRLRLRPVPNLFAHAPIAFPWTGQVQLGFGVHMPFAFALDWPRGWAGAARAESVYVAAVASSLTLSVPLGTRLAIGAGASVLHGQVRFGAALPSEGDTRASGQARLSGQDWDWNSTLSLAYRPLPRRLHLGLVYRTAARLALQGDARFSGNDPRLSSIYRDQPLTAALPLPWSLNLGAAYWPAPALRLVTEVDLVGWGAFSRLEIRFSAPTTPPQIIERDAENAFTLRQGAEWQLGASWLSALRAGLVLEQATAKPSTLSPATPDSDRVGLSAGAQFRIGRISVDAGYLYLHFLPAEVTSNREGPIGTYRAAVHIVSVTVRTQTWTRDSPHTP